MCQAPSGHSFVHRFTRSVPTKLSSFSQLPLRLVSEISFLPTTLPPEYLPSIPSALFQAVRILSIRSHTDTYLPPPHTPYLARVLSAGKQQQQRRDCPGPAPDLSLPEPLSPPPLSARLQDWVVSISPLSDWLSRFFWKPWVLDPFTANQLPSLNPNTRPLQ